MADDYHHKATQVEGVSFRLAVARRQFCFLLAFIGVMLGLTLGGLGEASAGQPAQVTMPPEWKPPQQTAVPTVVDKSKHSNMVCDTPIPQPVYGYNIQLPTPACHRVIEGGGGFPKWLENLIEKWKEFEKKVLHPFEERIKIKDIASKVVTLLVIIGAVVEIIVVLLALYGFWERGNRLRDLKYVFLAAIAPPLIVLGLSILILSYPVLILGMAVLILLFGFLGLVVYPEFAIWKLGKRTIKRYGRRVFTFSVASRVRLSDFHITVQQSIETPVTLFLARKPVAEKLANQAAMRLFDTLNLSLLLLDVFSVLAADVHQSAGDRLDALHWIGSLAEVVTKSNQPVIEAIQYKLLSFAEDNAQSDTFRATAAHMLALRTRTRRHRPARQARPQVFDVATTQRAWLSLAHGLHPIASPMLRVLAITILYEHFRDHRQSYAILQDILARKNGDHTHDELKVRAAGLLGLMSSAQRYNLTEDRKKALDYLRHYASNPDCKAEVRYQAAYALGRLGEADEAGALLVHLATQVNGAVRERAIAALYRLRQQSHLSKLAGNSAWKMGLDLKMRQRAAEFLNYLDSDVAACFWMEMADDPALLPEDRIRAACKALQDHDPRGKSLLLEIGEDARRPGNQRIMAARGLVCGGALDEARQIFLLLSRELHDAPLASQAQYELVRLHRHANHTPKIG
jgi:hypothetical protein